MRLVRYVRALMVMERRTRAFPYKLAVKQTWSLQQTDSSGTKAVTEIQ